MILLGWNEWLFLFLPDKFALSDRMRSHWFIIYLSLCLCLLAVCLLECVLHDPPHTHMHRFCLSGLQLWSCFWRSVRVATFTWTLFASIRMNSFWLTNPNVVFTWTLNKVIGLMWSFICHKLLIGFNLLTCAHCMNIQSFPLLSRYCFKKHTWYLFTSGPN